MSRPFLSAVVLAAGSSRRMGDTNKLLLPFGGRPLVAHVVDAVCRSKADEVVVVLGHEAAAVRAALEGFGVAFAVNDRHDEGMATSIAAGVLAARPEAEAFMLCLSDLPLIEVWELDHLIDAYHAAAQRDAQAIVRPVYAGTPGHPVLFSAAYRGDLAAQRGVQGCRGLVKAHPAHVTEVEMETDHVVHDVDTPEAFRAAAALIAAR